MAYAYFTDGSADEITVSKVDKTKVSGTDMNNVKNTWFKYVEKDGKYELTTTSSFEVATASGDKVIDYKDSALKTYIGQGKDSKATKDTIFVVLDDDDNVKVYTGIKNVPPSPLLPIPVSMSARTRTMLLSCSLTWATATPRAALPAPT